MKKFLNVLLALALVFGFVLVSCDNGGTTTTKIVSESVGKPSVTKIELDAGVMLTWNLSLTDVDRYEVWRKGDGQEYKSLSANVSSSAPTANGMNNLVYFIDIYDPSTTKADDLQAGAKYTYQVRAIPKNEHQTTGVAEISYTAKSADKFPALDAKPAAPEITVDLHDSSEDTAHYNRIEVTIKPPASGIKAHSYTVSLTGPGYATAQTATVFGDPTKPMWVDFGWTAAQQIDGDYTATVTGSFFADNKTPANSTYTAANNLATPETGNYSTLFDRYSTVTAALVTTASYVEGQNANSEYYRWYNNLVFTNTAITGYTATLTFTSNVGGAVGTNSFQGKPGVKYTVQRAESGTTDYADITWSYRETTTNNWATPAAAVLEPVDDWGHITLPVQKLPGRTDTAMYDLTVGFGKTWVYRLKAEKGSAVAYKAVTGSVIAPDSSTLANNLMRSVQIGRKQTAANVATNDYTVFVRAGAYYGGATPTLTDNVGTGANAANRFVGYGTDGKGITRAMILALLDDSTTLNVHWIRGEVGCFQFGPWDNTPITIAKSALNNGEASADIPASVLGAWDDSATNPTNSIYVKAYVTTADDTAGYNVQTWTNNTVTPVGTQAYANAFNGTVSTYNRDGLVYYIQLTFTNVGP